MSLIGKVAVITGGGGVIGKAVAQALVNKGAKVVVGDIQEKVAKDVADELNENAKYAQQQRLLLSFSLSKLLSEPMWPAGFKRM